MAYFFLAISILSNAVGQILMKFAADSLSFDQASKVQLLKDSILNGYLVGGMVMYVVGLVSWLLVLSRLELSAAYPYLALTYVLVTVASFTILNETITAWKLAGTIIIIIGIIVLSVGVGRTT